MRSSRTAHFVLAAAVILLSSRCFALRPSDKPNGISVGKPKVFDNRTLTLMLESLGQTLQSMQSQSIDVKSLAAALQTMQGFRSTDVTSNFNVSTLPIPGLTQQQVTNTGAVNAQGSALPPTTQMTTTSTQNPITPQPPTLDTSPTFSGFTPNYGESPSDLLNDQVNLTYQIFNLRMILERALSDRLLGANPRLQAVLGFNITIDPPNSAKDAVAVVEITLSAKSSDDLSLVALMPQEKTYNSAALSTKSRSFGGSAVVKMIQVGYSERHKGQVFYLYRDNDTISYERMVPSEKNKVEFGWMFRPVLGRRSVSPGWRQLFAIAALPTSDGCAEGNLKADTCPAEILTAHVRTFWKKFDANTMTSASKSRYVNEADYEDIYVSTTPAYQKALGPAIDAVSWIPVGLKNALVSVSGANFFSGTQVVLGDKTYIGGGDGLVLKSNQAFDLTTSFDALLSGPGAISGRYGPAIPFIATKQAKNAGILIDRFEIGPSISGVRTLRLYLKARDASRANGALAVADLPLDQRSQTSVIPLIAVNGNTILPYSIDNVSDVGPSGGAANKVLVRGAFPDSFLTSGTGVVRISWPFLTDIWTDSIHVTDPSAAYHVYRLGDKSVVLTSSEAAGFTKNPRDPSQGLSQGECWEILAGAQPTKLKTSACPSGDHSVGAGDNAVSVTLDGPVPDKIVLVDPLGSSFPLDVPKSSAPDSSAPKALMLNQYESVWIEINVDDASKVNSVEANKLQLKFSAKPPVKPGDSSKTIRVEITRDLTAKPGNVDVTVLDKDGKSLATTRLQISCSDCKSTEASQNGK
jgi:hypothetical protein